MRTRTRLGTTAAATAALAVGLGGGLAPVSAEPAADTLAQRVTTKRLVEDLKAAKGLTVDERRRAVVAQGAFADPEAPPTAGKLVRYDPRTDKVRRFGKKRQVVAIARDDVRGGWWTLTVNARLRYQQRLGSKVRTVKNMRKVARNNPDPYDTEGNPTESNPFGLTVDRRGRALVTDAAANSLVRVGHKGKARVIARFATEMVSTDHLPADAVPPEEGPLPPQIPAEAVPTDVQVARNGAIFVSELKGFPFRPESSRIWRVKPRKNVKNPAVCAADRDLRKNCRTAARDLTAIASFAHDPGRGFLVASYAAAGVLAFEGGCFGPDGCPPAVLTKVRKGKHREVAEGRFSAPGTVRSYAPKRFYVTDQIFGESRLSRVRLGVR